VLAHTGRKNAQSANTFVLLDRIDILTGTTPPTTTIPPTTTTIPPPSTTIPPTTTTVPPSVGPSGQALPVGNLPGWRQIFVDDFTTDVPLGSFPSAVAQKWGAYPSPWKDTSKFGTYSPLKVVEVSAGVLTKHLRTEAGVPLVAALTPKLTPTGGGTLYGRYAIRFRSDPIRGYKIAWLLWPDSEVWPRDGEIDFPEANLDATWVDGYVHRQGATAGDDQAAFGAPADLDQWHTAVIEWSPGLVVFTFDGVEIGRTTLRVPNTKMHWVIQTETEMGTGAPPPATSQGRVQIDWVAAWAYDTTVG
jgi:hypothetical protein